MKENNIVQIKSFAFSVRVVKACRFLQTKNKEFILSNQLLKSGTSIGANVEEALGAQSKKDFIAKISIAYKESRETIYWIKLLFETNYITEDMKNSLLLDVNELNKIISSILVTSKKNNS